MKNCSFTALHDPAVFFKTRPGLETRSMDIDHVNPMEEFPATVCGQLPRINHS
jgi:hypothetical protein